MGNAKKLNTEKAIANNERAMPHAPKKVVIFCACRDIITYHSKTPKLFQIQTTQVYNLFQDQWNKSLGF